MFSRKFPKVPKAVSGFLHKITTSLSKLGSKIRQPRYFCKFLQSLYKEWPFATVGK